MKIFMMMILNVLLLIHSPHAFNVKKMSQGNYLYNKVHSIDTNNKEINYLKINLQEKLSETFISEYHENQNKIKNYIANNNYDYLDTVEVENYLAQFFALEIENYSDRDYSISDDMGLPIIQEAKDKNGEWKPIEYIELNGNILYSTIELLSNSKIEIAAPRYSGKYQTELRIKIAIQQYGILTSQPYKGSINYKQFIKPKSRKLNQKISFLE